MRLVKDEIKHKKAFTLIEMIVVIAVIGILVLLAAPKFLGYTEEARLAQIQSDIRVVEGFLDMERVKSELNNEVYLDSLGKLTQETFEGVDKQVSEGNVYNNNGLASELVGGPFYNIPDEIMKEVGSNLQGSFITNEDGEVYYINDDGLVNDAEPELMPEPESEHLAKDEDFEWISDFLGYPVEGETGYGYYKYIGDEEVMEIPHEINGHNMTSYYKMFYESDGDTYKMISTNKKVTDMDEMFKNSQVTSLDLSSFDTSNVTDMTGMFEKSKATSIDLSELDTSNVTDMRWMFRGSQATELDLSNFNTSNVTDMTGMFESSKATSLNLSSFDTSKVTDISWMFYYSKATELDLSSFNTTNVTDMKRMFSISEVTSLDLSSFNTNSVTDMSYMFSYSKINSLDLSNFNTSSVTDMSYMFNGSEATELDLISFDTSNVDNMEAIFHFSKATSLNLSSFDTGNVTNMINMFTSSKATTGFARNPEEADKFNSLTSKPAELIFEVK